MKRNVFAVLFASALGFTTSTLLAETADNFNSRTGIKINEVKGYLQGNCWFFSDFDVNRNGWAPNMEGDGAMVSGTGASATEMTGIFSPILDIPATFQLSFKYKFSQTVKDRRWIKVFVADGAGSPPRLLDSLELTGSNETQVYFYNKALAVATPGQYKVYINYQGIGGDTRIAIDQLSIGANTHYQGACNVAPMPLRDKFTGSASHTATGNVLANDTDPNHETLTAYLMTESEDGRVDLNRDGSFTFTPKEGFTGNSTKFTYKVCDNGSPALCSMNTTAVIKFSSRSSLTNFQASYRKGAVDINWNTAMSNNANLFEVERSLDGNNFEKVGEVEVFVPSSTEEYTFSDKVKDGMVKKNDLYYRLRQTDASHRVTYSKVLIVRTYGTKSVEAVSVTPDPGVNDIQVNVQLKERSFVMMRVSDKDGSEIIKKTAMGQNGSNMYNIEGTSDLQPGTYQLEVIINSNERLTMKLAKS